MVSTLRAELRKNAKKFRQESQNRTIGPVWRAIWQVLKDDSMKGVYKSFIHVDFIKAAMAMSGYDIKQVLDLLRETAKEHDLEARIIEDITDVKGIEISWEGSDP